MEGIDHKKEIADNEKKLKTKNAEHKKVLKVIDELTATIATYEKLKELWDQYNKAELLLENKEMELSSFNGSLDRGKELGGITPLLARAYKN